MKISYELVNLKYTNHDRNTIRTYCLLGGGWDKVVISGDMTRKWQIRVQKRRFAVVTTRGSVHRLNADDRIQVSI